MTIFYLNVDSPWRSRSECDSFQFSPLLPTVPAETVLGKFLLKTACAEAIENDHLGGGAGTQVQVPQGFKPQDRGKNTS